MFGARVQPVAVCIRSWDGGARASPATSKRGGVLVCNLLYVLWSLLVPSGNENVFDGDCAITERMHCRYGI